MHSTTQRACVSELLTVEFAVLRLNHRRTWPAWCCTAVRSARRAEGESRKASLPPKSPLNEDYDHSWFALIYIDEPSSGIWTHPTLDKNQCRAEVHISDIQWIRRLVSLTGFDPLKSQGNAISAGSCACSPHWCWGSRCLAITSWLPTAIVSSWTGRLQGDSNYRNTARWDHDTLYVDI